jgi:ubiquitin-conjugating enzyme E2 Z
MAATTNLAGSINRITKEILKIKEATDLSLGIACRDEDVRKLRGLIVGPSDSPYEFGFYEFVIKCPRNYPIEAPVVKCITTNGGRCRFNPNIYADGKVCLSILGTWRGEAGEQWSSAQGLESVLLSIQSLMSSNPYENEPGFEAYKITQQEPQEYARKIAHENLRISVIQRLEQILGIDISKPEDSVDEEDVDAAYRKKYAAEDDDSENLIDDETPATEPSVYEYDAEASVRSLTPLWWDPFADFVKRRFLWYYDSYVRTIDSASKQQKDGKAFIITRFEGKTNEMAGSYQYLNLRARLDRIRRALATECDDWKEAGEKQVKKSTQLATQLAFQFNQLTFKWNESPYSGSKMEISLPEKDNPFIWHLTIFGEPSSNLDGGVFNLSLSIPPNFPEAWPRVYVETPIFHHRVSSTGALCYFPAKADEIGSHLTAIVEAIEDKQPMHDPRAFVHPEAAELYWGGDDKRKIYFRKLRRSAQDSSEV